MNRTTPQMRRLAKSLMAYETPASGHSEAKTAAAFPVIDRLHSHLAALMGIGGFRALLSRAVALIIVEVPWMRTVTVKTDGTLEGLEALHEQLQPGELREGKGVLLAQLLGLLVTFIGPGLTSRLVGEIWPQIPPDDLDFGNGDRNGNPE
jgi:hypothetical protein